MAKPSTFKVGDIVQLKSGGPKMTVHDSGIPGGYVRCQWFAGSKLNDGHFDPETLEMVSKASE